MEEREAFDVLDQEIELYVDRLAKYRRKADAVNRRRGERDIHADRLCEYAEHRLKLLREARRFFWMSGRD